jgi:hypothetical protein
MGGFFVFQAFEQTLVINLRRADVHPKAILFKIAV